MRYNFEFPRTKQVYRHAAKNTSALHNVQNKASSPVPCCSAASCCRQSSCTNNAQQIPPKLQQGDFLLGDFTGISTFPASPTEPFMLELAAAIELLEADDGENCGPFPISSNCFGKSLDDSPCFVLGLLVS